MHFQTCRHHPVRFTSVTWHWLSTWSVRNIYTVTYVLYPDTVRGTTSDIQVVGPDPAIRAKNRSLSTRQWPKSTVGEVGRTRKGLRGTISETSWGRNTPSKESRRFWPPRLPRLTVTSFPPQWRGTLSSWLLSTFATHGRHLLRT